MTQIGCFMPIDYPYTSNGILYQSSSGKFSAQMMKMEDRDKTTGLLLRELTDLRRQVAGFEILESGRKQAEAALVKSEQNFRNSLDDSPLPISINRAIGDIVYANQAMLEFFGYKDLQEMKSEAYANRHDSENIAVIRNHWEKIKRGEAVSDYREHKIYAKDGVVKDIEAFTKSITWDGEDMLQATFRDVTERKVMEDQLRHSQVLASLGELTAGIAHEVGNPLASIVLYSEMAIKGKKVTEQTKQDLRVIRNEARRAGHLMKDLLAYSRKVEPNMRKINVHTVIKRVVKMLQYQLSVKNINLTTDLVSGTLNANGDAAQLTQVFMNLIINASEAVAVAVEGNITVSSAREHNWIKIAIADDGPGISGENLDQIFMPFFTTKDIGEGTGLGLSMCYGIVTAHDGMINARNVEGVGAVFTVQLPVYSPAEK